MKTPALRLHAQDIIDDGKIDHRKLVVEIQSYLKKWLRDSRVKYEDPIEMERATHLPRWLGKFLIEWDKGDAIPQLPYMP